MLILGRKAGESIRIGEDVVIKIFKVQGGNITVGIEAPDDVKIVRSELLEREERFVTK
jgi:carbon storage regulator